MAVLCRELCNIINSIPNNHFTIEFDSKFSLVERKETSLCPTGASSTANSATVLCSEVQEVSNGHMSEARTNSKTDREGGSKEEEEKEKEAVSSEGEDMAGYESDTSSSSSGEDVMVVDSEEREEEEEEQDDEESASVAANIQQLKVSLCSNMVV